MESESTKLLEKISFYRASDMLFRATKFDVIAAYPKRTEPLTDAKRFDRAMIFGTIIHVEE